MPKKKKEDEIEQPNVEATETSTDETAVEAAADENTAAAEEPSVIDTVAEAASGVLETVATTIGRTAAQVVNAVSPDAPAAPKKREHKRAERVGVVSSDKMTKTVVVRVDRLVKHPVYRKYVKRRKKFMAHDETGAKIGDKVRIVETRPLSARKRWRVVEIIQKAEL